MKTIKQIADELKIDKQKVYRYIKKNNINEALQKNGVMYYDEAVETRIKSAFNTKEPLQESASNDTNDAVVDVLLKQSEMLQKELEIKNKQIDELNQRLAESQKLIDQQQQLNAITQQKLLLLQEKTQEPEVIEPEPTEPEKKSWWKKILSL